MPVENELERQKNKIVVSKIIYVQDLSDEKAINLINQIYNNFPYVKRNDNTNNTYWTGFTSNYVRSFKIIKNKDGSEKKDLDDEFDEIFDKNESISKIFKNTFVIDNGVGLNPSYIDTFIMPSLKLICIIGNRKQINRPEREIKNYLNDKNLSYDEINFSHDFLFWVLWKLNNGEDISSEISIDFFDNLKVGSSISHNVRNDNALNSIKTEGGGQELPSLPICFGLFNNKPINYLKGEFKYNQKSFKFGINIFKENNNEKSSMTIYAERSLSGLRHYQKLQLVLPFLYKLSLVVKNWENFDNEDKYPPIEFIDELFENAENDYEDMKDAFESYKKEYIKKVNSSD